ncbi:hypothetical protein QE437_004355 [Klebsiella variicola]|nr:hypothetical protein [Klebsiella variicola]
MIGWLRGLPAGYQRVDYLAAAAVGQTQIG